MKRLAVLLFAFWPAVASAATTYYVDAACPSAGTGVSVTCGSTGPKTDIASGIALLSAQDDVLNIRGIHGAHGSCPGDTAGRYQTDKFSVAKTGASGHPIIIQSYGWTAPGTGEKVYIDGTATVTWTQCTYDGSLCDCGPSTQNQTIGGGGSTACTETWWVTGTGNYGKAIGGQNTDGTPTPRYSATTSLTNAHNGYLSGRCTDETWRPCSVNADCVAGTCTAGATPEHDSYSAQAASADLLVRWAGTPASTTAVYNDSSGVGFDVVGSSYVTIRGIIFRAFRRQGIFVSSNNTVIDDVKFLFNFDLAGGGSGYGTFFSQTPTVSLTNSEIAYSSDEGIHTTAACVNANCTGSGAPCTCCTGAGAGTCAGPSALTISGNWIHDQGNLGVIGTGTGTPSGMICSQVNEPAHTTGPGDYTGSSFTGNLVSNQSVGGSAGRGLILESHCDNWTVRDNIFKSTNGSCLKFNPADGATNNTDNTNVFNNLFASCGDSCIEFSVGASQGASSNVIYNNTCAQPAGQGINTSTIGGTLGSNLIRNNIISTTGSGKMVNWTNTTSTNKFEYNLVRTTANPAITWLNVGYSNANIDAGCSTNCTGSKTGDPLYVNSGSNDYHIQTGSPAKDVGTATGMPAGRTRDVNNTIASAHGLVSYADNQIQIGSAWDMGADEFGGVAGTPLLTLTKSASPNPVLIGSNLTYTLAYSNTGSAGVTNAVITDTVPTNTTFVSATGGGSLGGGVVTWTIGSIGAGVSGSVQMVVQVSGSITAGTAIQNVTYALASTELATVTGTTITTSTNPPASQFIYPLIQRGNTWSGQNHFTNDFSPPTGDLSVGGPCDIGDLAIDTGGATVEWCWCRATNTWDCWKWAAGGGFTANGPAD